MTIDTQVEFNGFPSVSADQGTIQRSSLAVLMEMFQMGIAEVQQTSMTPASQEAQLLVDGIRVVQSFYGNSGTQKLSGTTVEFFVERLMKGVDESSAGGTRHASFQPLAMRQFSECVINWGLVTGVISVDQRAVIH